MVQDDNTDDESVLNGLFIPNFSKIAGDDYQSIDEAKYGEEEQADAVTQDAEYQRLK